MDYLQMILWVNRIQGVKDLSKMFRNYNQLETWGKCYWEDFRDKNSRDRCNLPSLQ
jgi:hypothetical protein